MLQRSFSLSTMKQNYLLSIVLLASLAMASIGLTGCSLLDSDTEKISELGKSNSFTQLRSEYVALDKRWQANKDKYPLDVRIQINNAVAKTHSFYEAIDSGIDGEVVLNSFRVAKEAYNLAYVKIVTSNEMPNDIKARAKLLKTQIDIVGKRFNKIGSSSADLEKLIPIFTTLMQTLITNK